MVDDGQRLCYCIAPMASMVFAGASTRKKLKGIQNVLMGQPGFFPQLGFQGTIQLP